MSLTLQAAHAQAPRSLATNGQKPSDIIRVHDTTLPHLDFIEKILLDELIRIGKAEIISENMPITDQPLELRGKNGKQARSN